MILIKDILIASVLLVTLFGCSNKKTDNSIVWLGEEVNICGELIYWDPELLYGFANPIIVGDNYIVNQTSGNPNYRYSLLRWNRDSIICVTNFLALGRGPKEVLIPKAIKNLNLDSLIIYDNSNRNNKIISIPLAGNLENLTRVDLWRERYVDYISDFDKIIVLDRKENLFLGMHTYSYGGNSRMYLIDLNRDEITPLNLYYPKDKSKTEDNINNMLRYIAYSGIIEKHPSLDRFVYISESNLYMQIFNLDYENRQIDIVKEVHDYYPDYKMVERYGAPNVSFSSSSRFGFVQYYTTKNRIYLLMNDFTYADVRKMSTINGHSFSFSNNVYVYDWDGNHVKKLVLDEYIDTFFVDDEDQYLFGTTYSLDDPSYPVVGYRFKID